MKKRLNHAAQCQEHRTFCTSVLCNNSYLYGLHNRACPQSWAGVMMMMMMMRRKRSSRRSNGDGDGGDGGEDGCGGGGLMRLLMVLK